MAAVLAPAAGGQVLRVGSYRGIPGQFSTIQTAVDAAKPGDWVLVGPGDYKTSSSRTPSGIMDQPSALLITTPRLHLRGMNRNRVVIDGTKPGSPQCSSATGDQNFGPGGTGGAGPTGLNGITVWKTDDVSIQNLTACNFLSGSGSAGNQIWWNGGDGGGKIGGYGFSGSYLTASSTYYKDSSTAASYGIFSSDWSGGTWDHAYASNMSDSDFYVGACQQVCEQTLNHVQAENTPQGFSGTNSGGTVVIENSEFDHNRSGVGTGALNNDDWPSPQDGACPGGAISPITHTPSCWVFIHNYVHDNNNPNTPGAGTSADAPTGTGLFLYGGRDDTIMDNTFKDNGAWGVALFTFITTDRPPDDVSAAGASCRGGIGGSPPSYLCIYDDWGNAVIGNTFAGNGFFGNASNGDIGEITTTAHPTNCFRGNIEQAGGSVTTSPAGLQTSKPQCDGHTAPADLNLSMTNQVLCVTGGLGTPCLPGSSYPRSTHVQMLPIPVLASMPHPCAGISPDPWCSRQVVSVKGCAARRVTVPLAVSVGERLRAVTVNGARAKIRAGKVRAALGARRGRHRVRVVEHLTVSSRPETVTFTDVYHRC
jgi:hypothetical protein